MKFLTAILLILLPIVGMSQLVTQVMSPQAVVQNVLLGSGVTVSNITFNGQATQIGSFTANGTNLGLTEGVIINTGTIMNSPGEGPHGPNNSEGAGLDAGGGGYSLLSNLIGGIDTYDAAILEFDFVPYSDSVRFNYVFASEEYLEYVGSEYNDVFAFYISGPAVALQNIAKLPNGQAVTINNVHSATTNPFGTFGASNGQFYVNNNGGATIQYDGFTKVLTAEAAVQCGETYHLIIAIADAGDHVYDSGIFLEANSLSSDIPVEVSHVVAPDIFGDQSVMAEGCVTTTVTLDREDVVGPLTVPIIVSGTAIENTDYSDIPNSVTFPAGQSTIQFSFDAFEDGLTEGTETIILTFDILDPCGNPSPLVLELSIEDIDPVEVEITGGTVTCPGEEIELLATPSGGAPPYTYLWSTGETTASIFVSPTSTQTYTVTVTDDCLDDSDSDSYELIVPTVPPLVMDETDDITEICPYIAALLESNATGGVPPYSYQWSSTFDPNLGTASSITAIPSTTTTYTVTVTDFCGNSTTEDIVYTITSPPLTLVMSPALEICPGDSAFITVESFGGYGQHYYDWLHSDETATGIWVFPSQTTTYTVSVSDECQTFTVEGSTEVVVVKPTADFTTTSTSFFNDLPITFLNLSQNATTYEWDFGDGNSDTFPHPSNTYDEPGLYYITLIAIDDKGCRDTITKPINIEEEWWIYVPNTFTPDGDRSNNDFRISTIGIQSLNIAIYNRWGEQVFEAHDQRFIWDGTYNGVLVNDGTYVWKIDFVTNSGREKKMVGHINVLK
ncbi:MAG: choice-of-anchor L domain-containing protein [Crocinitomicaceae bacterium]|nr:choice-of-anchor L domain-containing protein [Crocinitomicaceae bacterium]